ncbi:6-carboxytetrahydropterin synthase QueD [Pseudodesulfovibrio sp.]|uniref:6-carboxytetrahydropterin synthase QueD n=1 Tax=unclassified Pseudodesulfovibrio TaxID=2661612 RepID=UPI003B006008
MPGKWRLAITQDFSASHQLRNYGGKCEQMHGHNFGVEVVVEGADLDEKVQYLMDFKALKRLTKEVLDKLDHHHLNEVECFTEINPSSENLAMFIYRQVKPRLPENVRLVEVSVSEKPSSKATYWEE